ncbi:MAG: molybdate ABC transporter substrate-binding protein [Actinomycetota bacterium]|nr:molybdate ABC transporter substrate-binding protein [Actinomycetota bacterium]
MRRLLAVLLCSLVLVPACSGASSNDRLTVLAAASLTEAFQTMGRNFEKLHPGVTVRFSFGPSDGLATQIQGGAPGDVFASASEKWMDAVAQSPGVADRSDFARNRLVVVVPASNPGHIASLSDLARPGVKLVLAAEGVPAGDYGREILANAGIVGKALANVVSNEVDVKGVLQKVESGDADAGIVYITDVTPDVAGKVTAIPIPDDVNVVAAYAIGVVDGSRVGPLAKQFVRYALGPGQMVLRSAGFLPA